MRPVYATFSGECECGRSITHTHIQTGGEKSNHHDTWVRCGGCGKVGYYPRRKTVGVGTGAPTTPKPPQFGAGTGGDE